MELAAGKNAQLPYGIVFYQWEYLLFVICREEHRVGFEDHVLLDHLLEGFPKKGMYSL